MRSPLLPALLLFPAAPVQASELFGGLLAHDVDTPPTKGGRESGVDVQLGWRGDPIPALDLIGRPAPYAFVSIASEGDTHMAAIGLSWRIGGRLYARPGIGLAVHTRSSRGVDPNGTRADLGSRLLFQPELGLGYRINARIAIEATWVHVSHAQLLSRQNPGMDSIGARLTYRLR